MAEAEAYEVSETEDFGMSEADDDDNVSDTGDVEMCDTSGVQVPTADDVEMSDTAQVPTASDGQVLIVGDVQVPTTGSVEVPTTADMAVPQAATVSGPTLTTEAAQTTDMINNAIQYFSSGDQVAKKDRQIIHDGVRYATMAKTSSATFYDNDGRKLIDINSRNLHFRQRITPRIEHQMAHLAIMASAKVVQRRIIAQSTASTQEGTQADGTFDEIEIPDDSESTFGAIHAHINYEAMTSLEIFDLGDGSDLTPKIQHHIASLPEDMRQEVLDLHADEMCAMVLQVRFDVEKAAVSRVYASTPSWATAFAAALKTGHIWAVCLTSPDISDTLGLLQQLLVSCKLQGSPLNQFHKPGTRWIFKEEYININPGIAPESHSFQPCLSFHSKEQYLTIFGVSILSEQQAETDAIDSFGKLHKLVFQAIPEAQNRAFIAYLRMSETTYHLKKGTKVKLNLAEANPDQLDPICWSGKVISPEHGPLDFATLLVHRPWDRLTRVFVGDVPEALPVTITSRNAITDAIVRHPGIDVRVEIETTDKVLRNLICATETMNRTPKNRQRTEWNETIEKALLCNRFDTLPPKDAFAAVRPEFPDVTSMMQLNGDQRAAVVSMQHAPGGLTVVNGPPGTGKSKFLREILKPFLRSQETHTILVASASNVAVNSIAEQMETLLREEQAAGTVNSGKYGLRAHSKGTETALRKQWAEQQRIPDDSARPPVWDTELIIESLDEVNKEIAKLYMSETARTVPGIDDIRVQHPLMSIGKKMLEISGVVQGPSTHNEPRKFKEFRQFNKQFAKDKDIDSKQMEEFKTKVDELWEYTVQNASFIVGTTSNMGSVRLLDALQSRARVVMIDEAAHEREDQLIPFFAAQFQQLDAFVQVGDWLQLLPLVTTTENENLFCKQLTMSFMARLVLTGFTVLWFNEQHRMVASIADIANELTYSKRLITAPDAQLSSRHTARAFRNWARTFARADGNHFLVNVLEANANTTLTTSSKSKYNDVFVVVMGELLITLLALNINATIALLTGYNAQKTRLRRMIKNLEAQGQKGLELVTAETIDAAQGQQYDIVIMDILTDKTIGFLNDQHRMNVAMTRARNGMIVVADIAAVKACKPDMRGFLAQFLNTMSKICVRTPVYDEFPTKDWYNPASDGFNVQENDLVGHVEGWADPLMIPQVAIQETVTTDAAQAQASGDQDITDQESHNDAANQRLTTADVAQAQSSGDRGISNEEPTHNTAAQRLTTADVAQAQASDDQEVPGQWNQPLQVSHQSYPARPKSGW